MEDNDAQLQLKKRSRRRLVGAIAFVSVVAVVLPMVMDHEPRQVVQDVEIRIPGQDEKPFAPKFATPAVEKAPTRAALELVEPKTPALEVATKAKPEEAASAAEVSKEKAATKAVEKPADKAADKTPEKPVSKSDDAKRAAAILAGQPAAKAGEYLVLIGAFSNEANVKILKAKLGEQGIKTFSEPLETPQGKKTRVRAGPFASREAAEKAREKMQRIGVSGVVTAK